MWARRILFVVMFALVFGFAPTSRERTRFVADANAGSCDIDDNRSDTVTTFVGRCCKGSVRSVMPGNMWSKTVGDVKDNRSKNDDSKTCWKLISRDEYRK